MFDLKSFRKNFNITQTQLAELFNCRQSNISMLESGFTITTEQKDILIRNYGEEKVLKYFLSGEDINEAKKPSNSFELEIMYLKKILNNHEITLNDQRKEIEFLRTLNTSLLKENEELKENKKSLIYQLEKQTNPTKPIKTVRGV
jgi:transcriptional regulator with XRE-family HTH domain